MRCLMCIHYAMFDVFTVESVHLHDPPGHQLPVHGHGAPLLQRTDPEGADRDHLHPGQADVLPGQAIPLQNNIVNCSGLRAISKHPTIRPSD